MKQRSVMVAIVLAWAALFVGYTAPPAWAASLSVSPTVAEPGGTVTATGGGFEPGLSVIVCWGSAAPGCRSLGETTASDDGAISVAGTVPADAEPGDWEVSACQLDPETPGSCVLSASATLSVPAPVVTTSSTSSTTTTSSTTSSTTTSSTTTSSTTTTSTTTTVAATSTGSSASSASSATTEPPDESVAVLGEAVEAFTATSTTVADAGSTQERPATSTTVVPDYVDPFFATAASNSRPPAGTNGFDLTNPLVFWGVWLGSLTVAFAIAFAGIKGAGVVRRRRAARGVPG